MFLYGPATSLSSPILIGAERVCALMTCGRAIKDPAATLSAARRVIVLFTFCSSRELVDVYSLPSKFVVKKINVLY
jgi:hypothetical protein